ncbi:MAG TPA: TerB family tellurite resistance protein [Burkholderiales bacterium]|nr:TerB family tellurite resistance protein [Burkholderiales bacterium]
MLRALKGLLAGLGGEARGPGGENERAQLELAVAGLLLEMMRVDFEEKSEEAAAVRDALAAMFGLDAAAAQALVARAGAHRYTSYFGPVGIIKRLLGLEQRVVLVEHLWRIAFADARLDPYEDHFVRKIAHLLYVSNTDAMLARQRAKGRSK